MTIFKRPSCIGICALLFSSSAAFAVDNVIGNYILALPGGELPEGIMSSHPVNINTDAFFSTGIAVTEVDTLSGSIDFTLPNGNTIRFNRSFDDINYNNSKYAHWSGTQLGVPSATVSFTLSKAQARNQSDMLFGSLNIGSQSYKFTVNEVGQQTIDVIDPTFPLDCGLDDISVIAPVSVSTLPDVDESLNSVIDIGVLYLPGGSTQANQAIEGSITGAANNANMAMETSTANSRLNLVRVQPIPPELRLQIVGGGEENFSPYFGCQTNPPAGKGPSECTFDGLHANSQVTSFRNDNDLDLVSFFLGEVDLPSGPLTIGVAELPNVPDVTWSRCNGGFNNECAYSMFRESSLLNLVFAHEVGHNIGLFHNVLSNTILEPGPVVPAARGYINENASEASIMVFGGAPCNDFEQCPRVMTYSNPAQGTGVENTANSVNGLNLAWPVVANYRGGQVEPPVDELLPMGSGFSGTWDIASTQNEGIVFEINPSFNNGLVFGAWFAAGNRWLTLQSLGSVNNSDTEVALGIYQNIGGVFNDPTPTQQDRIGTAILSFTRCTDGLLEFSFNEGASGSAQLIRSTLAINCDSNIVGAPGNGIINNFGLTGAWHNPSTSGQGLVLEVNPANTVLFGGWFTYASNGSPFWYTVQSGYNTNSDRVTAPIRVFNSSGSGTVVGEATITFIDGNCATLSFAFSEGTEGVIPLSKITGSGNCPVLPGGFDR